ncbi:hypothetical protein [Azohydromonas aeria]|uniref:hypothetical protein n=1 Tax=Azohydromonas aeria TaxID=2590212 RepID=UPI0012FA01DC|nr:hypothetical protein [Azohydromonas aeria]
MRHRKANRKFFKSSATNNSNTSTYSSPKAKFKYSLIAAIIFVATGILAAITWTPSGPNTTESVKKNIRTEQPLEKAFDIKFNMNQTEVEKIMGRPAKKEITTEFEEWHYCRTGEKIDEFIAIRFKKQRVTSMENYIVSSSHVSDLTGDCMLFIKWGTYGESRPNKIFPPGTLRPNNRAASAPIS